MTLKQAWDLKVYLEYGQFHLEPDRADDEPYPDPADDTVEILHRALGWTGTDYPAPGVAPELRVEVHDGPPADDMADWQEVFEAGGVTAGPDGIWYHAPTMESTLLPVPAGTYRIRISGRDFHRPQWNEEDDSLHYDDKYRFQLWSETQPIAPIRLKRWDHPESCGHI